MRARLSAIKYQSIAFVVPFCVRLIPEVLAYPYPLGFDTIAYYIPIMQSRMALVTPPSNYLGGTILPYLLLTYAYMPFGSPMLAMKIIPSFLLGVFSLSVFLLARKLFGWSEGWALLLAFVNSLYFVMLRVSWDLHRNVLGLCFLLLTIALLSESTWKGRYVALPVVSSLAVMTHDSSAVLLVLVAFSYLLARGRYRGLREWLVFMPAFFLLALQFASGRGLGAQIQTTYVMSDLLSAFAFNLGFLLFSTGFLAPLALIGFKGGIDRKLALWGSTSLLFGLLPNLGYNTGEPHRWIFLLSVPVAVLFVQGIRVLSSFEARIKRNLGRLVIAVSLMTLVLVSSGYVGLHGVLVGYFRIAPEYRALMPMSMVESTISVNDVPSFVTVATWANATLSNSNVLVLPFQLYGWYLTIISQYDLGSIQPLDQRRNLDDIMSEIKPITGPQVLYARTVDLYTPNGSSILVTLANKIAETGSASVYVVWWNPKVAVEQFDPLLSNFVPVFSSGRFAVYSLNLS